ncbi:hypothetical protein L7F22_048438 [Adiantum nelumboides]|nr:hypothetical protein [Adiantum nelumboides]
MHYQKSARQWWASLRANGEASRTWKNLRASIMKQFLSSDAKDKVLTEWRSLKLTPFESIHKYVGKFWDLHLKATVYKKIDFEEQKQQFCAGLPEDMNEYVNSQRPKSISAVIHHTMVAARINFQQSAKRNLKPMETKEKHEHKGKNQPQNSSKGNSSNNKAKEKGVYKEKNRFTLEELERYRKDNRCFKCEEQGHVYRACPQRNARNEQPRASIIEAPKEDVHCKGSPLSYAWAAPALFPMSWANCPLILAKFWAQNSPKTAQKQQPCCADFSPVWWILDKDSGQLRIPYLQTDLGRVLRRYAAQIHPNSSDTGIAIMADRNDDVTEEVSSSQGQQTHEVGESSRPPLTEDEIFRTQLVTAVAMFTQVMQNPRFMAFLQPLPQSQTIGNKKSEPAKAQPQERIQLETARLYKQAGVNPLAGCLPTLATIPVWIGLYRALSNVANEGLLTEGFFWIPSLAGPTTIAARQNGSGISWLFPFVDGAPPLGWSDTIAYLVLPVLLIGSQYVSMELMQTPQSVDPSQKNTQAILKFLPLMIGYFALSVPSGLSLYWLTNNILSTGQQLLLRKGGAAKPPTSVEGGEIISAGQALRSSAPAPAPILEEIDSRGERFRQLKMEEARRKAERAEALKKASEMEAIAPSDTERDDVTNDESYEKDDETIDVSSAKDSLEEMFIRSNTSEANRGKHSKRKRAA